MRISDWSSDVCSSDLWTLGTDDLRVIVSRRRPHNRLGFAIQLCALRYPGRLLRPGELIPHAPLAFVADQLDLDPRVLADYAVRGPTRYEQLDTLRDVFGFRSEEHTSELQSLMRISYAVFCLKKKKIY